MRNEFISERSTNYRYNFFRVNKGINGHRRYYHCSYCGRIKKKDNITVDHLIPVNKVVKGKCRNFWRGVLQVNGVKDINDIRNLVPACRKCNSRKSANTGMWILRGIIGKHFGFWCVWKPIKLAILVAIICYMYTGCPGLENLAQIIPRIMHNAVKTIGTII